MAARTAAQGPPHEHDHLIRKIAESETFQAAPTMRALLLYLWEHQGEQISEYAIATEALGRSPEFDPKLDSTVRVHIARLRAKLKEFHEHAGDDFPLRLSLPVGRHELLWKYQPPQKPPAPRLGGIPRKFLWAVAVSEAALAISCAALLVHSRTLRAPAAPNTEMPRFWQSFLMPGKPTTIVVPSPTYFFWPSRQIYIRDLEISDFAHWTESPFLKETAGKWGAPELSQIYVGAMEMTAGIRLLQYLEKDRRQEVRMTESRKFPAESFASQNTIFLGMPRTAGYLKNMLEKTNFYIERVSPDLIRNRDPKPGEPAEFREVTYSADRRLAPAIIVLLPARPEHTRMLMLLGRNQTSITSMLISLEGLKALDSLWAKCGSPEAWEMVIEAEVYRDTVLKTTPVACRPIPATFWN
jgi:hypothetical protein